MTEREFADVQKFLYAESGIALGPTKQALVVTRLGRRLRALGLSTVGAYLRHVQEHRGQELVAMLDALTTNETHFFREPRHFELLERHVFPRWRAEAAEGTRSRRIRVWSAASSTGEEPYSLAMLLLAHFPADDGWQVEIAATDLSTRVLAAAEQAVWPMERASEIPRSLLRRFMLRGTGSQEGRMRAAPELRTAVRFSRLNLNDATYPLAGPFDLIFCRNVMIYFDLASKQGVVQRLFERLAPDGLLFLGHAETLTGVSERGAAVVPTVYAHRASLQSWTGRIAGAPRARAARQAAGVGA
jgi:chemotaxis protein methyltransferase CheR